eukprot:CAMPEP_0118652238 /NCGR_PEP_ID=MMETSP0785-20121206/11211_1 /TAXON_ID=91992 /ORGANISM="Bolidomonas pacifica, Strain CCMP 1866" /LENGTH=83 /DNA_ID=CAMNT_0006544741 /DNA_START=475 /DNA_END=726 /DNA_ORIENTATION=+
MSMKVDMKPLKPTLPPPTGPVLLPASTSAVSLTEMLPSFTIQIPWLSFAFACGSLNALAISRVVTALALGDSLPPDDGNFVDM